jgi:hypothetical protein
MATKTTTSKAGGARKQSASAGTKTAAKRSSPAPSSASAGAEAASNATAAFTQRMGEMSKLAKVLTPEQALEMYRANARMALDVINAAIESTAKMRRLQFQGEEDARSMQRKAASQAAEAGDAQSLMAAGQNVTQEAVQRGMRYWGEMFELIVEMQKRLFTLMEGQMAGVPGVKEAKAALAMMPDLRQAQNLVQAMQGVMTSGTSAFESMQKVMGDFTKMAQGGMKR